MEQITADDLTAEQKLQVAETGRAAGEDFAVKAIETLDADSAKLMVTAFLIGVFEAMTRAGITPPTESEIQTLAKMLIINREADHGR